MFFFVFFGGGFVKLQAEHAYVMEALGRQPRLCSRKCGDPMLFSRFPPGAVIPASSPPACTAVCSDLKRNSAKPAHATLQQSAGGRVSRCEKSLLCYQSIACAASNIVRVPQSRQKGRCPNPFDPGAGTPAWKCGT